MPETPPSILEATSTTGSPMEPEAERQFLRERLSFYSRLLLCLCFGFYVVANLLSFLSPQTTWHSWVTLPAAQLNLTCCLVFLGMWLLARRGSPSMARLRLIDAGGNILFCGIIAIMNWFRHELTPQHGALLALTNVMIGRAVIVPSRAGRTLWVSVVASLPLILTSYLVADMPEFAQFNEGTRTPPSPLFYSLMVALWCVIAIFMATVTSWVIYGLRIEVSRARRLGQYTLIERIGGGGMGEVYKASHALLRRPTAVKLLRPHLAGEQSIARFEREVQLTSLLTHPNTIAIYDYGRTPDGIFYYAMEYLSGLNLEELARGEGAQPPGRVIHLLRQICASLAEAHGMGLIHRDVKGANVLLTRRGGLCDVVKVVDFGLVKDLGNLADTSQSAANVITGTPLYLSPEAIRAPEKVDHRSDLYSVGILGYLLVSGKLPFEGTNFVEICGHHLHTKPLPPSERLGSPVPRDLEEILLSCLEKEPGRRPDGARRLQEALAGCRNAGGWTEEQARGWWESFELRPRAPSSPLPPTATLGSTTRLDPAAAAQAMAG